MRVDRPDRLGKDRNPIDEKSHVITIVGVDQVVEQVITDRRTLSPTGSPWDIGATAPLADCAKGTLIRPSERHVGPIWAAAASPTDHHLFASAARWIVPPDLD